AIHVALKKLEEGCSVEDAMAVCDLDVLDQITKWKAIHVALKKLEEGCSVEDAMAVCDLDVLDQITKWK
nr:protein enhanced downy mildew 2-like [Tanacetum cinerariifolium]